MIDRVYHHYEQLEEARYGLWKRATGDERKSQIARAALLMRDAEKFKSAMRAATEKWPLSCEHNLTCLDANRIAWLGHAGCCIGAASGEDATRAAWHTLSIEEQDAANAAAEVVLMEWVAAYSRKSDKQLELL